MVCRAGCGHDRCRCGGRRRGGLRGARGLGGRGPPEVLVSSSSPSRHSSDHGDHEDDDGDGPPTIQRRRWTSPWPGDPHVGRRRCHRRLLPGGARPLATRSWVSCCYSWVQREPCPRAATRGDAPNYPGHPTLRNRSSGGPVRDRRQRTMPPPGSPRSTTTGRWSAARSSPPPRCGPPRRPRTSRSRCGRRRGGVVGVAVADAGGHPGVDQVLGEAAISGESGVA